MNKQTSEKQRSSNRWFLTSDAANFVNFISEKGTKNVNLYLFQNRYCYEKDKVNSKGKKKVEIQPLLMELLDDKPISSNNLNLNFLLNELVQRNEKLAAAFPKQSKYDVCFPGRIMLGEGGNTPYSNIVLLKLHPLYGVPFVPASTIKGILRSCWSALYAEAEENADDNERMGNVLFGTAEEKKQEGKLIFFDVFPTKFTLTLDIENPHYPKYYNNGGNPTDDQNPIPIKIICMEDVTLSIHLACKDKELWAKQEEKIREALKQMIEIYGVGAKTALGYGIGKLK